MSPDMRERDGKEVADTEIRVCGWGCIPVNLVCSDCKCYSRVFIGLF